MKSFSKISSVIIVAAMAAAFTPTSSADEIVIKPLRTQPAKKSLFVEKVAVKPMVTCAACKDEFVPTVTQDTKLKTKTILVATRHTCGAILAAVETCCGGMK